MAVRVFCNNPEGLLEQVKQAIRAGTIDTWSLDSDGDFTHTPSQWQNKAWFRPMILSDRLLFTILGNTDLAMSSVTYGVYHGRLIEMLLTHFDSAFTRATATAMAADGDTF